MREKELRRSMSVLPIGTVMKLTDLSARQIRYYEQQDLIKPLRNEGNRRMYSLNDVDRLLEIKDYLDDGLNISGIKEVYKKQSQLEEERKKNMEKGLTDSDVRKILQDEFLNIGGLKPPSSTFDDPNNFTKFNK
ncbi:MerR family transcriptional regulator [Lentilactobacillus fungorum]|uniref:MerR family transcriptional regulator n=1 Tax=Lentilactobacillus fungorum TaxID=2201250 RepID=A0ABQ3VVH7_9LACO|nr:MerR family transcriptional regulator [Lentilactobacillus fungorum]GHP12880.1 MerR family transcriptional regulator [Lentilactobacillus fungorum]